MRTQYLIGNLIGVIGCVTATWVYADEASTDHGCSPACQHNVESVFAIHPHYRLTVKPHEGGSIVYVTWSANQNTGWTGSPVTYKGVVPFPLSQRVRLKEARVPAVPGDGCHGEIVLEQGRDKTATQYRIDLHNVLCRP